MSGVALIWAANVKGLKPAAKVVLIQLADFHNKETGRCDPSAKRLAYECEMDRATVFRHMKALEERGLVTRHARGDGDGGRGSNHYELHIDLSLGPSSNSGVESQIATGVESQKGGGLSRNAATGVVANCDTNLLKEPGKNLTPIVPKGTDLFSEQEQQESQGPQPDFFDDFWKAYPKKVAKPAARKAWNKAVKRAKPETIIAGAKRYAAWLAETPAPGDFRPHAKHPQGWLNDDRWTEFVSEQGEIAIRPFEELTHLQISRLEDGQCPAAMQNADGTPNAEGLHWLGYFGKWRAAE